MHFSMHTLYGIIFHRMTLYVYLLFPKATSPNYQPVRQDFVLECDAGTVLLSIIIAFIAMYIYHSMYLSKIIIFISTGDKVSDNEQPSAKRIRTVTDPAVTDEPC